MKSLLKNIVFYSLALFLSSQIVAGLKISGGFATYLLGGTALSLLFLIVKPILSIVTLPLTIITLGWFSLIINAVILYFLTILVATISISAFMFNGFSFAGFVIPSFYVNGLFSFVFAAIVVTFIVGVLRWLTNR